MHSFYCTPYKIVETGLTIYHTYRVFIKYCGFFSENFVDFLNSVRSMSDRSAF